MKSKMLIGFALLLLALIPQAEAIEINELNDTSTSKNLTYTSPGSKLEYISIYKYANISKAEWDLTGFPSAEGLYAGDYFPTNFFNNEPQGITQNGTYFWISDWNGNKVYKYHMNGTYTGDSFSASGSPLGITQNGTFIWIVDYASGDVYKYHMNGTYTGESFNTGGIGATYGITEYGGYLWVTKPGTNRVEKLYMNGTNTGDYFGVSGDPFGITQNGTFFWIVDNNDDKVYKYYINGTDTGYTFDIGPSHGIVQNGTYFWIVRWSDDIVYKYYMNEIYPSDITIDTGNDGEDDYTNTTTFDSTETIGLNLTAIHNYLGGCSSDPCGVPFDISSNTVGTLEISAINITYGEYPILTNCSEGGTTTITFHNYFEANQSATNGTLDVTFSISDSHGNQTNNYSFEFSSNETHSICLSPAWASYQVDMMAEYDATGFSQRTYHLNNATITNSSQDINLYLLDDADSDAVLVVVRDKENLPRAGVSVQQIKFFVGSNTYLTVAILNTSVDGQALTFADLETTWYKWIVTEDGVVMVEREPQLISDTIADPEVLEIRYLPTEYEYFEYIGSIGYNCTVNKTSEVIRCTVTDSSGLMNEFCMKVDRLTRDGYVNENQTCETSSGVTLAHTLTNTANQTYRYELKVKFPETEHLLHIGYVSFLSELVVYGLTGVFVAMLVIITMSFVGLWSPSASIMGGVIGLLVCVWANLIVLEISIVVGIMIAGGLIIVKGRW